MPQHRFVRLGIKRHQIAAKRRLAADPTQNQLRDRAVDIGLAAGRHMIVTEQRHRATSRAAQLGEKLGPAAQGHATQRLFARQLVHDYVDAQGPVGGIRIDIVEAGQPPAQQ